MTLITYFTPQLFFFLIGCAPMPTTDLVASTETLHQLSLSSSTAHHILLPINFVFIQWSCLSSTVKCSLG